MDIVAHISRYAHINKLFMALLVLAFTAGQISPSHFHLETHHDHDGGHHHHESLAHQHLSVDDHLQSFSAADQHNVAEVVQLDQSCQLSSICKLTKNVTSKPDLSLDLGMPVFGLGLLVLLIQASALPEAAPSNFYHTLYHTPLQPRAPPQTV